MHYTISEDDHTQLERIRDLADLLTTGMSCAAATAEEVHPRQVAAATAVIACMVRGVLQRSALARQ